MQIAIVTAILVITLILLISEKLPLDVTAIAVMVALMVSGILTPVQAVAGFANPAVITVAAMFLISQAMIRTGAVGEIGQKVLALARGKVRLAIVITLLIVGIASAFINNTPVVVLFIPVILSMGCRFGVSPSKYLIPLSYVSIMAGTCTLIGTSTNIIISDLSARYGHGALSMFEIAKVGLPIAVVGFLLVVVLAPRLMPDLLDATCELNARQTRTYLAELTIPRGSPLAGLDPCKDLAEKYPGLEVIELIRYTHVFHPCRDTVIIAPDDRLLIKASPNLLMEMINSKSAALPRSQEDLHFTGPEAGMIVELVVTPASELLGQKLRETDLARDLGLEVMAVERSGLRYTEKQIDDIRLRIGDMVLVWCRVEKLERLRGRTDWIVVEDTHHHIVHKHKGPLAGVIFAAMVVAASTGLADIMLCALAALLLMVMTGCLPIREAYRALQPHVLILIVGTIALGTAMDQTGTSRWYADLFLGLMTGRSPTIILAGILILTSLCTHLLSNNATAVLLLPIAISTAAGLGVSAKPFIIAVCIGASACFATPIGYQTNLLVYAPGGYRFSDYFTLGMILNVLVVAAGTILIPIFWPF
jgi:di/tricarboxylate transporter